MAAPNSALLTFITIPDCAYRHIADISEHLWGRVAAPCWTVHEEAFQSDSGGLQSSIEIAELSLG